MTVVWSSNAYHAGGTFGDWTGTQEISGDRATIITPPAEIGGGPKSRSHLGRYRINATDNEPFGNPNAQRCEALAAMAVLGGRACQGSDIWVAWETCFPNPSLVSDSSAFRPHTGSGWNTFSQFHQNAGATTQPVNWFLDCESGTDPAGWLLRTWTRGGNEANPTGIVKQTLAPFEYGWWEFKAYLFWGQANGRLRCWYKAPGDSLYTLGVDYTGPVGFAPDSTGGSCNYFKQGMYRGKHANNMTIFHAGTRMGTTEADVDAGGGGGGDPDPPPSPAANTRERRFGKANVGASRNGHQGDVKSGSKFATGLAPDEEGDVKDMHIFAEGMDGSALTQSFVLVAYADDGGNGFPGTKFGETQEASVAGNSAGQWIKITLASPIRIQGANVWLLRHGELPTNRIRYAHDEVANGLFFGPDAYGTAPHANDPCGAGSLANLQMSIIADYDVVEGSSGGGGDITPPVLQSAVVNGNLITLGYDEPLNVSSEPDEGDFTVTVNNVSRSVVLVDVAGSQVQLGLSSSVFSGDLVRVSYARVSGREIEDLAGNLANSLTNQLLDNQTSSEPVSGRSLVASGRSSRPRTIGGNKKLGGSGGGV